MLHPSYFEVIDAVNKEKEEGQPDVQSRYSIIIATAKRARQLIDGDEPKVKNCYEKKPVSIAVDEIYQGKVKITANGKEDEDEPSNIGDELLHVDMWDDTSEYEADENDSETDHDEDNESYDEDL